MDEPSMRASDADREAAVIALREHLVAGRLTLEEFSERVEAALRAGVTGELVQAQQDLPAASSDLSPPGRKPTRLTTALFGHVARRGRLRLRRWTVGATAFGDLDLDLRDAVMDQPRAVVNLVLVFGNVDVYVPEHVNIEVSGIPIFGHLRDRGQDRATADAPTIRVRAVGFLATVDVWRVPNDAQGSYRDIMLRTKEREQQLPAGSD
jgi:hypothetical protein